MLVGTAGSGKTTIFKLLAEAETNLDADKGGFRWDRKVMNPKAITSPQMYGNKDEISQEYTPGIFSTLWKKCNNRQYKVMSWLTCDGPVDAIWIENLNTVLDDNKLLTLANGERIPMTDNCKMVFEVENLNNASPATVSRAGIVFVSESDLSWEPYIETWLKLRNDERKNPKEFAKLRQLYEKYLKDGAFFSFLNETLNPTMKGPDCLRVKNFIDLFTILMNKNLDLLNDDESFYEKIWVFAMAWAFGGTLEPGDRLKLNNYLEKKSAASMPKNLKPNESIFEMTLSVAGKWES